MSSAREPMTGSCRITRRSLGLRTKDVTAEGRVRRHLAAASAACACRDEHRRVQRLDRRIAVGDLLFQLVDRGRPVKVRGLRLLHQFGRAKAAGSPQMSGPPQPANVTACFLLIIGQIQVYRLRPTPRRFTNFQPDWVPHVSLHETWVSRAAEGSPKNKRRPQAASVSDLPF